MKVLVVAATKFELNELISVTGGGFPERKAENGEENGFIKVNDNLSVLITGVGMVATAFALGKHLAVHAYDLLLNLGIAGSFDRNIAFGEVVEVITDTFSELGAEDDTRFIPISALGFSEERFEATAELADYYTGETLRRVSGITVNTVHGNEHSIQKINQRLDAQVESMEGAAFFYASREYGVPALQIRAMSNYVEKRNRDAWQIELAIKNLNNFAVKIVERIMFI